MRAHFAFALVAVTLGSGKHDPKPTVWPALAPVDGPDPEAKPARDAGKPPDPPPARGNQPLDDDLLTPLERAPKEASPAAKQEDPCQDRFEDCNEDCTIDHTNDDSLAAKGRRPLEKCVTRCLSARDTCHERRKATGEEAAPESEDRRE